MIHTIPIHPSIQKPPSLQIQNLKYLHPPSLPFNPPNKITYKRRKKIKKTKTNQNITFNSSPELSLIDD